MSQNPVDDALRQIRSQDSEHSRAYDNLRSAFTALKKIYGENDVLSATDLGLEDPESRTVIHLTNLAQLGMWLTQGDTDSLSRANDHFLRVILANHTDIASSLVNLYLSIKTQLAIESIYAKDPEQNNDDILAKALNGGLREELQARHEGQDLPESEQALVTSVDMRHTALSTDVQTADGLGKRRLRNDLALDLLTFFKLASETSTWPLSFREVSQSIQGVSSL